MVLLHWLALTGPVSSDASCPRQVQLSDSSKLIARARERVAAFGRSTIVTAALTDEHLDRALAAFDSVGHELGIISG